MEKPSFSSSECVDQELAKKLKMPGRVALPVRNDVDKFDSEALIQCASQRYFRGQVDLLAWSPLALAITYESALWENMDLKSEFDHPTDASEKLRLENCALKEKFELVAGKQDGLNITGYFEKMTRKCETNQNPISATKTERVF